MHARGLLVCAAALFSGCTLVLASDLDDARELMLVPDGGATSSSSSTGGVEAGGPVEGGASEAGVAEDAGLKGCAVYEPAPKFCDDFDRDAGFVGWEVDRESGNSTVVSEQAFSAPSSARVEMIADPGECQYSRILRSFGDVGSKRVTITLRMRLQSPWPDGMDPIVFDLYTQGVVGYCAALFFIPSKDGKPISAQIDIQSAAKPDDVRSLSGFPSSDEWAEMKIQVTPIPTGGSVYEVTFMDPNGFTKTSKHEFAHCPPWNTLELKLGTHCDRRAATMFFDDVRVDWE